MPTDETTLGKWTAQLEGARLAEARRELAAEDAAVKEGRAVYNDVVADCDDHSRALDSALASAFEDGAKYARALTAPAAQEGTVVGYVATTIPVGGRTMGVVLGSGETREEAMSRGQERTVLPFIVLRVMTYPLTDHAASLPRGGADA